MVKFEGKAEERELGGGREGARGTKKEGAGVGWKRQCGGTRKYGQVS